jgi:hypothetical protein
MEISIDDLELGLCVKLINNKTQQQKVGTIIKIYDEGIVKLQRKNIDFCVYINEYTIYEHIKKKKQSKNDKLRDQLMMFLEKNK